MLKSLLILGAGIESIEGYLRLKKYKCKIIAVDKDLNAPGLKYADLHIRASIYNYREILKNLKKKNLKIFGIISFGDVSYVATKLCKYFKINSIPLKSAKITSDKLLFKEEMKNHFNIPYFKKITNLKQIKKLINTKKNKFIIKPVDNCGARGVIILDKDTDINWAYKYCLEYSKKDFLIAEEFINGPQLSTEGIIFNGEYIHLCTFDRNYEMVKKYRPFIIENGGSTPSKIGKKYQNEIIRILSKISKKLGLKYATLKGDLVLSKKKIFVIEVATRLSGGWLSSITIPNTSGVNIIDYVIKNSLKLGINKKKLFPKFKRNIIQRYLFPKKGLIKSVNYRNKLFLNNKNILTFKLFCENKKLIEKIDSHASRIGHVIVKSSNKKKGIILANKILKNVEIKYH